jgi:hypothetical protein
VAELRAVFQQHIRNDKDELLPVVLKVLSEDEVEAVVEKVEEEIAGVEETKRAAAEQRRTRRGRKQADSDRNAGESLLTVVEAEAESAQELVQTEQETVQERVSTASEAASLSISRSIELVSRPTRETPNLMNQDSERLQAVVRSNRILIRGAGTIALEWLALHQDRLLRNLDGMNDLLQCRSVPDIVSVQSTLIRENVERMIESSRNLAQLTVQVTQQATRTITAPAERDQRAS